MENPDISFLYVSVKSVGAVSTIAGVAVKIGGIGVAVGGTGIAVGVGGTGVLVEGTGVAVDVGLGDTGVVARPAGAVATIMASAMAFALASTVASISTVRIAVPPHATAATNRKHISVNTAVCLITNPIPLPLTR